MQVEDGKAMVKGAFRERRRACRVTQRGGSSVFLGSFRLFQDVEEVETITSAQTLPRKSRRPEQCAQFTSLPSSFFLLK